MCVLRTTARQQHSQEHMQTGRQQQKRPGPRLEALVEAGVLSGRGEVGDGVGVGAALGDGGLAGVVGRVVVQVGHVADEAVGVAHAAHAHLLPRHELQRPVRAKVQHRVRLRMRRTLVSPRKSSSSPTDGPSDFTAALAGAGDRSCVLSEQHCEQGNASRNLSCRCARRHNSERRAWPRAP